jgi:single-stranded DNA-specific DHH superfamily exonuclease
MDIEYLIGSKEEFFSFVEGISEKDKIAIFSHTDLDGVASAIFLKKILEIKGKLISLTRFVDYENGVFERELENAKKEGITKIFVCDFSLDNLSKDKYLELTSRGELFLIDHHPTNLEIKEMKNTIKTNSYDCSAMTIYNLGEGLIDSEEWEWLVCAAMFSDFSYSRKENFNFINEIYPDFSGGNLSISTPGLTARKISSALIYFSDKHKVYDLLLDKKMEEISSVHEIVEDEINDYVDKFMDLAEFYANKKMYYLEISPKFNLASIICSLVSKLKPEYSFVIVSVFPDNKFAKASARNQGKVCDMGELMKKAVEGLKDSNGGGHIPAAAARFRVEDLKKFKENLLNFL